MLKRCIQVLIGRGLVSPRDIPFRLGLDDSDVEELAGFERSFLRTPRLIPR